MSDCCASTTPEIETQAKKLTCPFCNNLSLPVSAATIRHHLKQAWAWGDSQENHYFCAGPGCEVVYFTNEEVLIKQSALRTQIGIKCTSDDALLCYCYGVSRGDAKQGATAKAFVIAQTKAHDCACDSRNPSGRCCLKDFPK